ANLYELLNTMRQFDDLKEENDINARHEALVIFLKLLQPFAPHMSEELWTLIGNEDYCMKAAWPIADARLITSDEVTLPIQINGKKRDEITVPKGLSQDEIEVIAKSANGVKSHLAGKNIRKFILVKDRIINIVTD
ncbi:MAG: class I tRNA ligase family protein, partial [Caulobacterales bacterium]|nr:class I tRNA ligase family protein [Caulobacterales bacterium]